MLLPSRCCWRRSRRPGCTRGPRSGGTRAPPRLRRRRPAGLVLGALRLLAGGAADRVGCGLRPPRRVRCTRHGPAWVAVGRARHLTYRRTGVPGRRTTLLDSRPVPPATRRSVVLVSGAGTNLQALLDAARRPGFRRRGGRRRRRSRRYRGPGPRRARRHPDVRPPGPAFPSRRLGPALAATVAGVRARPGRARRVHEAGRPGFLAGWPAGRQHPPRAVAVVPGDARARDALEYGVKVTGCTLFVVDDGVDTGPIVAQPAVPVTTTTRSTPCTSGSRPTSGGCWSTPSAGWHAAGTTSTDGGCASGPSVLSGCSGNKYR